MINYNISLNKELAQIVEEKIKLGKYANRSEFFREMIRKLFVFENDKLEIEEIKKGTKEYEELKKLSEDKDSTRPYSEFLKELKDKKL
jgi:Arc/MetJ-type ribon-helix-helix transcriptional regulator